MLTMLMSIAGPFFINEYAHMCMCAVVGMWLQGAGGEVVSFRDFCIVNFPKTSDAVMASIGGNGILHASGPFWVNLIPNALGCLSVSRPILSNAGSLGLQRFQKLLCPESDFSFDAMWTFFERLPGVTLPTNKDDKTATGSAGARAHTVTHTRNPKDACQSFHLEVPFEMFVH